MAFFPDAYQIIDQVHQRAYYLAQIKNLMTRAGFRIDQSEAFSISFL